MPDPAPQQPEPTEPADTKPVNQIPSMPATVHSFSDASTTNDNDLPSFNSPTTNLTTTTSDQPVPVVKVLSVRGVEYGMMTITLWVAAASLAGGLVSAINGGASFEILAFPISLLLVTVPVFAFFFLRLKKAELANPSLRLEASKRRFSQVTQFLAFLTCLINVIVFVYLIMASFGGKVHTSWLKAIGDLIVILIVAGGVLAYYWFDEHKLVK